MISVTKTFLPPQEEYNNILKAAWQKGWITNRGSLVLELEDKLTKYLKVPHMIAMTNGTLPLQIAIKALELTGEIITTPFSYVATTSSIVWENCKPVFVDIDPEYLTINEKLIEAAITSDTTAILATHVFGNPCNVEIISEIAKKYDLKVIYDAAHCFAVNYKGTSIFNYGDVSTCSFHATKLFHTGEGGAAFTNNDQLNHKMFYFHNFGHKGQEEFYGLGVNAKMSELQAAMGLSVFPYINELIEKRKQIVSFYNSNLSFAYFKKLKIRENTSWNYSYYPILFTNEEELLNVQLKLRQEDIFPRRYFYPSLHTLPYVESQNLPIAKSVAERILCLPIHFELDIIDMQRIVNIINKELTGL